MVIWYKGTSKICLPINEVYDVLNTRNIEAKFPRKERCYTHIAGYDGWTDREACEEHV